MTELWERPGQLTDQVGGFGDPDGQPVTPDTLKAFDYEWLSFQVYNPHPDFPPEKWNLNPGLKGWQDAGLEAGVWATSYAVANFQRDGKAAALQAKRLGAQHLIADIESCLKDTRSARAAKAYILGCRAGGWTGPVHLTTFGCPSDPLKWDFAMDVESFLETGGGIFPQAYPADGLEYTARNALTYWSREGVNSHPERINVMLSVGNGPNGRRNGEQNASMLLEADAAGFKVGRRVSVYMAQYARRSDLQALAPWSLKPSAPPPAPNPEDVRAQIVADADTWLTAVTGVQRLSRLRVTRRIAAMENTTERWGTVREQIAKLLDDAQIP